MDVSNLLAFTFKKKFENKGSQMGHTKKTKTKTKTFSVITLSSF
jgi:hypothetical protein